MHFTVDNESDRWSEKVVKHGEGRRYSKGSGHEYFDERGEVIDYLRGFGMAKTGQDVETQQVRDLGTSWRQMADDRRRVRRARLSSAPGP